jgi:hypothetical protein
MRCLSIMLMSPPSPFTGSAYAIRSQANLIFPTFNSSAGDCSLFVRVMLHEPMRYEAVRSVNDKSLHVIFSTRCRSAFGSWARGKN